MRTYGSSGAIAAVLLLVTGCSGDDTEGSERPPPATTAADGAPATTSATTAEPGTGTTEPTTTAPSETTPTTPPTTSPTEPSEPLDLDDDAGWDPIDLGEGRWLAFVSGRTGAQEVFAVDLDTSTERQLTSLGGGVFQLTWSPDGSAVAFQCPSDLPPLDPDSGIGPSDICVLDVGTGELVNVTDDVETDQDPRWSPDGGELAFLTIDDEGARVRLVGRDGGAPRVVAEGGLAAWSPHGTEIAVVDLSGAITAANRTNSDLRVIVERGAATSRPAWSPDGAHLAFECLTDATDPEAFRPPTDICIVAADGTGRRVVADVATIDSSPAWSPDGAVIAFTAIEAAGFTASPGDVHVVPAEGGGADLIAAGTGPAWSPDGASLAFVPADGGIVLADLVVGETTTIVIDPTAGDITWAPDIVLGR